MHGVWNLQKTLQYPLKPPSSSQTTKSHAGRARSYKPQNGP